jgi:DNA-binding NarL/FixJ family response regulator
MRRRAFATALVGSSALFREGLARILCAANFRIVASASCVADLGLGSRSQPHPALLIIDAGNKPSSAVQQIEVFKEQHVAGRIAVVADHVELSEIVSAFRAGVNAYLIKVSSCDAFIKSLELVMLGETILPSAILPFISDYHSDHENSHETEVVGSYVENNRDILPEVLPSHTTRLSARQRSILCCLIEGDSNKTIARKIDIAEATVKVHIKTILRKIGVHNRTQAAIWAKNNSPFPSDLNDCLSASATTPVHQYPPIPVARVLSEAQENGSASLPVTKQLPGASHVELSSIERLAGRDIN